MTPRAHLRAIRAATLVVAITLTAASASAAEAQAPSGLVPWGYIGWKTNRTTGGNACTVASTDQCQSRMQSTAAGGFGYPVSVTGGPRDIYVAEILNDRVQELTPDGAFVSMFGWNVNRTNDERTSAGQAQRNVCTAASKDICGIGEGGAAPGGMDGPASVAVDPLTGDLYVLELGSNDFRVDKYSRDGRFVWRLGKDVNRTAKSNLCTSEMVRSGASCGAGMPNSSESSEHGAFKFANQSGDLLAVDPRRRLLYIGDEHRVQVFGTDGRWKAEIQLTSISAEPESSVVALALDPDGELHLVYRAGKVENYLAGEQANIIRQFSTGGYETARYRVSPRHPGSIDSIQAMAIDADGQLAVMGVEVGEVSSGRFGLLYDAGGISATEFAPPIDNDGIGFNDEDRLYVATAVDQELAVYDPAPASGPLIGPVWCDLSLAGAQAPAPECALPPSAASL